MYTDRVSRSPVEIIGICGITDPHKSPIKAERRDGQQRQFSDDFRRSLQRIDGRSGAVKK